MAVKSTITLDDTAAAYGAYTDLITANLSAALATIGKHYQSTGTIDVLVKVEDLGETTLATGGADTTVYYRQYTQPDVMYLKNGLTQAKGTVYSVHQSGAAHEILTGTDPNGTDPDITITINAKGLTEGWFYFDTAPKDPNPVYTPVVPADKYDFYSIMQHELVHGLGVNGLRVEATGALPGTDMSTFDRWVTYYGIQPSPLPYFSGASAMAVYGNPVPLVDGNLYHYTLGLEPLDGMMGPTLSMGKRLLLNTLDLAMLRDLGLINVAQNIIGTNANETLAGGELEDNLSGAGGDDLIMGGGGKDVLAGGDGNDDLRGDVVGQANADILVGDAGNDRLDGGLGDDWEEGGAGNDTVLGSGGADTLKGNGGNDSIYGDYYADRYNSATNAGLPADTTHVDLIEGGDGDDWIAGGAGADLLAGGTGADRFAIVDVSESKPTARDVVSDFRGSLKETFTDGVHTIEFFSVGGAKAVMIPGQAIADFRGATAHTQRDRIDLSEIDANQTALGKQGFAFIDQAGFSAPGQVRWYAEGNNIVVEGNVDTNTAADFAIELRGIANYQMTAADFDLGGDNPNALLAAAPGGLEEVTRGGAATPQGVVVDVGAATVSNGLGAVRALPSYAPNIVGTFKGDRVIGDGAANRLWGDDGDDTVLGGTGSDALMGGYGRDQLFGGANDDALYGNADPDLLFGNRGADALYGGTDADTLYGNQDNDALYGNIGGDELYGGGGDDALHGGRGHDRLFGDLGNDTLAGDRGNDTMWGGGGADRFVIGSGAGADVVMDFDAGSGDRLVISTGWQVGQDGAGNAVLQLSGGNSVTLMGVAPGAMNAGWVLSA